MAEEIKDLGGLVNQDTAFSKLPQTSVYDSENFRIITTDGATTGARENIKGTVEVAQLSGTNCTQQFLFDVSLNNSIIKSTSYYISLFINGVPQRFGPYQGALADIITAFANDLVVLLQLGDTATSLNLFPYGNPPGFVLKASKCFDFQNPLFFEDDAVPPTANNSFYYQLIDDEFSNIPRVGQSWTNPVTGLSYGHRPWLDLIANADVNVTPNYLYTTGAATGIGLLAGVSSVLRYRQLNYNLGTKNIKILQYTENANSASTPFTFFTPTTYPLGPHTLEFSYHFQLDPLITTARMKVWGNYGPNFSAIPGTQSTTIFGAVRNAYLFFDINLLGVGNSSCIGNSNKTFTYTLPSSLANLNGEVLFEVAIEIELVRNPIANPNAQWNVEFYLDYLRLKGPRPLATFSPNLITINTLNQAFQGGNIIGWTALRDDLYLFTTDGVFDPDDPSTWGGPTPPVSNGQIWKFTYDKAGDYSTPASVPNNFASPYGLTLIYQNLNLGLTKYRPIANPGMIESRYESPSVQKIYWTDNYNVPRQINVADPNVANLTLQELSLQSSLSMDLPVITQVIDNGNLMVGVYQVAYRLKNINGAESRFSRTSQLIPIIDASESNIDVTTYFPTKNIRDNANKSIKVVVDNIDSSYNTIEFATLYYFDANSLPEINIVKEINISNINPITNLGKVEITITGAEVQIPITVDEFTAFNTVIKRAKTLAAKQQTLFLGNIVTGEQIVDWDARAYRFPANDTITYVEDLSNPGAFIPITYVPGTNSFEYNGVPNSTVPKTADCIQSYALQSPNVVTTPNAYLYQPNSTVLGGAGPNVKYEFITENIKLDNKNDPGGNVGVTGPHMIPDNNWIINLNTEDRVFRAEGASLSNSGSPYVYDLISGYRRDEMYRFGIVFFDELDNPTYVNWIADIRMPHIYMPDNAQGDVAGASVAAFPGSGTNRSRIGTSSLATPFSSDPLFYDQSANDLYARILGLRFTIDFSSVPDQYKKASIVRVVLKDSDKHILGQGLFLPTYKYSNSAGPIMSAPYTDTNTIFTEYGTSGPNVGGFSAGNQIWYDAWTFRSPEFLYKSFPGNTGNNYIDIVNMLDEADRDFLMVRQSTSGDYFRADTTGVDYNGGDAKFWTAKRTKYYKALETATTPNSLKNTSLSQNPYPIEEAFNYPAGGSNRAYIKGSTLPNPALSPTIRTIHGCNPRDINGNAGGGNDYTDGTFSYGNKALFVQLKDGPASNWNYTPFGNQFPALDNWETRYWQYLANYTRDVAAPYGGQGYFARTNSEYIHCNNLIDISNKTNPIVTRVFGGDTTISVLDYVVQFFDRAEGVKYGSKSVHLLLHMVYVPVETGIALEYRRSYNNSTQINDLSGVPNRTNWLEYRYNNNDANWYTGQIKLPVAEYFEVDPVFNRTTKSVYKYFAEPFLSVPNIYDCRVWKSEKKIDGEFTESWSIFKPLSFLDVESAYGPLNNLVVFQNKLYYFQDRGFGVLQVAEQRLLSDADNTADLILGTSGILERYDYISTKTGTKHQFSMHVSDYSMVWFDVLARKMYRYKPGALEPLSDIKGFNAYLYERTKNTLQISDNPYIFKGIHSTYDYRYNEFYMTFLNETLDTNLSIQNEPLQFTLVYNDLFDGYVGKYTHYPKVYINDKVNIFSTLGSFDNDSIFMHNVGEYGKFYFNSRPFPSKLSFVVNSNPTVEKVFTNLELHVDVYRTNTISSASNNPLTEDPYKYKPFAAINFNELFYAMRVYNTYQNTDWIPLSQIARRHKTLWNVKVPSDRVINLDNTLNSGNIFDASNLEQQKPKFTKRLKDKWFVVDLTYSNSNNNKLVAYTAKAIYSLNSR